MKKKKKYHPEELFVITKEDFMSLNKIIPIYPLNQFREEAWEDGFWIAADKYNQKEEYKKQFLSEYIEL